MSYVTVVFQIQDDQKARDAWRDVIPPLWLADDESAPVRITAMSCDHEMERVQHIQEAVESHTDPWALRDEIQRILSCPDMSRWPDRKEADVAVSRIVGRSHFEIDASRKIVEHGPSIGTYRDRDIPDYIVMEDGSRFKYDRVAAMRPDGNVAMDQLQRDETIIAPGLVYRQVR